MVMIQDKAMFDISQGSSKKKLELMGKSWGKEEIVLAKITERSEVAMARAERAEEANFDGRLF